MPEPFDHWSMRLCGLTVRSLLLGALALGSSDAAASTEQDNLFGGLQSGQKCGKSPGIGIWCTYAYGGLNFNITNIGTNSAKVTFVRSNNNDKAYAKPGPRCVVVAPGRWTNGRIGDEIYVSLLSGSIYRNLDECLQAPPAT